jgi:hypothetical protein
VAVDPHLVHPHTQRPGVLLGGIPLGGNVGGGGERERKVPGQEHQLRGGSANPPAGLAVERLHQLGQPGGLRAGIAVDDGHELGPHLPEGDVVTAGEAVVGRVLDHPHPAELVPPELLAHRRPVVPLPVDVVRRVVHDQHVHAAQGKVALAQEVAQAGQ